jgi:anti-sigma factor RsiW
MHRDSHPSPNPPPETPLTEADQMLAMAFADGELHGAELEAFTKRVSREPELARTVEEFRKLELLTRQLSPPEPRDLVWREHASGDLHRLAMFGSYACFILAAAVGLGHVLGHALGVRLPGGPTSAAALAILGGLLMLLESLRWRHAERHHDPYIHVRR